MNTNLSSSVPSQLETDCLVVVVLDQSEKDQSKKDKPAVTVESSDDAVREAARDVISAGEVTGKTFETTLLHNPAGLKAKRLLLLGGGKATNFSAADLRKLAGTAGRPCSVSRGRPRHRRGRIHRQFRSRLLQERS